FATRLRMSICCRVDGCCVASNTLPRPCCPFFFNDTATTEIYTLSLHDALPILALRRGPDVEHARDLERRGEKLNRYAAQVQLFRSEEHTSELQSLTNLVCRLLLEKKKRTLKDGPDHVATHITSVSDQSASTERP